MRWRWNYDEMGDLLRGPEMRALLADRIDKARAAAEAIAPTGDPAWDPHPGLYRESFETSVETVVNVQGNRVAAARLTNTAPYAAAVEYGNGRVPAHHVLLRAIDHMRE